MLETDIDERFREELRAQPLPPQVRLEGDPMLQAVASELLRRHAPRVIVCEDGAPVRLYSLESFGAAFLAVFLEERELPKPPFLLTLIPEELILAFARKHQMPIVEPAPDPVRVMLDRIAHEQPQTYFSLARSAHRLLPGFREQGRK